MRRAAKRDDNEQPIIDALRKRGHLVQQLSQPGVPDLLVAGSRRIIGLGGQEVSVGAYFVLLEVKARRNKRGDPENLKPLEAAWHAAYVGWPVFIVTTPAAAIDAVERVTPEMFA